MKARLPYWVYRVLMRWSWLPGSSRLLCWSECGPEIVNGQRVALYTCDRCK